MMDYAAFEALLPQAKQRIMINEPMARHTTFRVGGPADLFFEPGSVEEIRTALVWAREHDVAVTILGNGSNVVVADRGIRGMVISLGNQFAAYSIRNTRIEAQAGLQLARLAAIAMQQGLGGFEFASGIPGTVGGAVMMNAGAYDRCLADVIVDCSCLMSDLSIQVLSARDLGLSYRGSIFADGERFGGSIIVGMTIELTRKPIDAIRQEINELAKKRLASQPLEWPSAGSAFKRPQEQFAGRLIADCGLKGCRIGGAEVSEKHAGFVINKDSATATDIRLLFRKVQTEVLMQTGVKLWPEVRFIGDWSVEECVDLP
jgi:UDP-N-acetylmuramate dehydrogenase